MIIAEEVQSKAREREFLEFPGRLYQNDPNYIRPLDKDIKEIFNPEKNRFFKNGECARFLFKNKENDTVGRVAVFVNNFYEQQQPTGGIGFFDCINDQKTADFIFNYCKEWLQKRGMEAMDGSINFGPRDKWWGILVDGFEFEPNYGMHYNFPYYKELFTGYGFEEYFKQYTYYRTVAGGIDTTIKERADRLAKTGKFRFVNIVDQPLDKVANDFREVYNKAWANYQDVVSLTAADVKALLNRIKPIMDRRLIWFGYFRDTPIAFAIMLPEVNQIFKYFDGKLGLWEKLRFWWMLRQGVCNRMIGVAFGIVPRFQKKGVESAMIEAIAEMAYDRKKKFNYVDLEHNWVGDFNPQMMRVHELMGGKIRKVHATYRYLFDRTKEFKRAPEVN